MLTKSLIAVCLILAATVAFAAPIATDAIYAATARAAVGPPSIADAQNALTGASTAWADILAAWAAIQPTITFITSVVTAASAVSAYFPHPAAGSPLDIPRKIVDVLALAVGHAKPGPHIDLSVKK